ncbi:hypothetical protein [Acidovorax sp.]|uniref:hypothetical protein n=1 Tax=Acidovorax sp. TaxID=1872122 RepID=UPI00391F22F6
MTTTISEVGLLAIQAHHYGLERRKAKSKLDAAYKTWREETSTFHHIERDGAEWAAMMRSTKTEYLALDDAKRLERNAQARLARAINKGVKV